MAYWIQEIGGEGKNNKDYKLFYCESDADLDDLPNMTDAGTPQDDSTANKPCSAGCEALVLDKGELHVLKKSTNLWEKLGG